MSQLMKRNEVKFEDTWAIEDLFQTEELWAIAYKEVEDKIEVIKSYRGKISTNSKDLHDFLVFYNDFGIQFSLVFNYAKRIVDVDTTNSHGQELSGKVFMLYSKFAEADSFVTPEILSISDEVLESFYKEEPGLLGFKRFIDENRRLKAHTLSSEMEELLASSMAVGNTALKAFTMFKNADVEYPFIKDENGELVQVTQGKFVPLLQHPDERIRKEAFTVFYANIEKYKNTFAALYEGNVNNRIFHAKARGYKSTLEAAVDGNNVSPVVYNNLIESVHKNMNHMHKYMKLRKKLLNVDEQHMYDVYLPLIKDVDKHISFDEAKQTVLESVSPLGKEYKDVLQGAFENRWIDVYENEGKVSGAYSSGNYASHPLVLMNYQGNLNNEFTLAHEMGHAMHSYLSSKHQNYLDSGYKIFVAEVASTMNEMLLMKYLMDRTTDKMERAYLINYRLDQYRTTVYRQTMFAEFEKKSHEMAEAGVPLTAEKLSKLYYDLNVQYFGDDVVIDKEIEMEWARIPHFYNNFYVYQYATSFTASVSLSKKLLEEGQEAVDRYLNFLSSGCTKAPVELLKDAGVDLTTGEPIDSALEIFGELVDELEALLEA